MRDLNWPPNPLHLCWAEVDLEAIRRNFETIRSQLSGHRQLYGVVKADAYGHGAVQVAKALIEAGCVMLCVARVEEALELRKAGLNSPILLFTPPFADQAAAIVEHDIVATVSHEPHLSVLDRAAEHQKKQVLAHLKIDTGMGRLGVQPDELKGVLEEAKRFRNLNLVGAYSHLPCADGHDPGPTHTAVQEFSRCRKTIEAALPSVKNFHLSNTAGVLNFPEAHFTAARSGISLYGQYPSADMPRDVPLTPAMSLRTRIVHLKRVAAGTGIGYGHTWKAKRESIIATIAIGYADGYPRHASNVGSMLLRGHTVPVAGRVCMDQIMLDVTHVPGAAIGDIVTAFGIDNDAVLRPEDAALAFGSIGYELTTRIGKRVPRFYEPRASA